MMNILITVIVLIFFSEGAGQWLIRRLNIHWNNYAAPLGAAGLFALSEVLYLPLMLLHLSSAWIRAVTMIVFICSVIVTLTEYSATLHALLRKRTLYIAAGCVLTVLLVNNYVTFDTGNPQLQVMALNAVTAHCQLENFRLQGYLLFGSSLLYYGNMDIAQTALTLTLFASVISFMLSLDIILSFDLKNPWFRFTLILFSIFYGGFNMWRINEGFSGSVWQLSFTALAIFTIYQWLKSGEENMKKLIPLILTAGLSVSNGFLMVSIEIIYCLMVYLLHIQKIRALYDTISFLTPAVIYTAAYLKVYSHAAFWIILLAWLVIMLIRKIRKVYLHIIRAENFLIAWNIRIFYVIIPSVFLIGTFILRFFVPGYGIHYSYYINYFSHHYVNGFLFPKGNILDSLIDVIRWAGLIIFLIRSRSKEDDMIKNLIAGMLVFFINPLCMGMLLRITGLEIYAYAFEIVFNPFTDILMFISIYKLFEWTALGQWVLELVLVFATLFGHITSFADMNMGLYTKLINMKNHVTVSEVVNHERL